MHGLIQSAVGAAAIRLEREVSSGRDDRAFLDAPCAQLMSVFDHIDIEASDVSDLESTLLEFAETWSGVCRIRWSIASSARTTLDQDEVAHFAVNETATEGCWNAIRHARATRIDVSLDLAQPRVLHLRVSDDGVPIDRVPTPGLGTTMLDDMTWRV